MFCNILVCVDGSPPAERALTEAIDIASASRARLTILTAVDRPPAWACTPTTAAALERLAPELERESDAILRAAVDRVPQSMPVTKILTHEPIRDALKHRISAGNHDLVVMGSRGRGTVSASLLGSVSHYALHHSHVPVLIVQADARADQGLDQPAVAGGDQAAISSSRRPAVAGA
jgi:nucleotide-binding universal stress UspA family protein